MSNLENLTDKIIADSEIKAKNILSDANREAEALLSKTENEALAESRRIEADAQEEAKKIMALTLSAKKIALRDEALSAKRQTIENILAEAKKRLSRMETDRYEAFLIHYLSNASITPGEKLRIPQTYRDFDLRVLNAMLEKAGQPTLTLDSGAYAENGFILLKDDVENNHSFDALMDYYRADLEQLIVERLYER